VANFTQSNDEHNSYNLIDQELKLEQLKFYRYLNREYELARLESELEELDRRRWGYPPLRSRRWGRGRR
jgi:hypothetical protein